MVLSEQKEELMFGTFGSGMFLCGGITQADGTPHPLALSVVLEFMDEVMNDACYSTSSQAIFQYKTLADLAFDCAFLAQGTPTCEREELIERCRKETAWLMAVHVTDPRYACDVMQHLRKRASDLETALRR